MKKLIYILALTAISLGCKSTKQLKASGILESRMSVKKIIKNHNKFQSNFTTLQGRLKVEMTQGDRSETHTLTLRMGYDNTIWINAFLNMVRVKITPDRVRFYNKLDNTYFDGDYALINSFLGTDLQFENLQNLLLGEALFELESNRFDKTAHPSSYMLTPKQSNELFDLIYLINPTYFKIDSQELRQPTKRNLLNITYQSYQKVDALVLPQKMIITATNSNEQTTLNLNLKSVILGQPLRFPFKIPKGYKAIELK
nr:deoxyuridine 5'-triphosphate nucleotidohydrolase [uncultured bacterium]